VADPDERVSAKELALGLPKHAWRTMTWRKLVVEAIRAKAGPDTEPKGDLSDRGVIDRYVTRIIVRPNSIDIELLATNSGPGALAGS
jgi:hypothetical protein